MHIKNCTFMGQPSVAMQYSFLKKHLNKAETTEHLRFELYPSSTALFVY